MSDDKLVKDTFNIDTSDLENRSEESEYWEDCNKFYLKVYEMKTSKLTDKQVNWLYRIESDLHRGK